MKTKYIILISLILIPSAGCERISQYDQTVVAPAAVIQLATGYKFTEGPVEDRHGNLYFTDIPNNKILIYSGPGDVSTYTDKSGGANGLGFDHDGSLLVCQGSRRQIISIDDDKNVTIVADKYNGKKLNSPNDLWLDPKGGIYFTDPRYGRRDNLDQDGEHVYYITPNRKKVIRVIDDMVRPNGIIGTPDGKRLYVGDHGSNITLSYRIKRDGTLTGKKLFATQGSDGMAMDQKGNVYLTSDRVNIYNIKGVLIDSIDVPERPSNVTFGGPDNKTLFITARTSLYSIRMANAGVARQKRDVPEIPGYHLRWADEFDGDDIDYSNWTHEVGDNWHNNELQAYTNRDENSHVANGKLVIVARNELYHNKAFTSARMRTKNKQDFTFGRVEARIRLPAGGGIWPAFWMMPSDDTYGKWAASGEIDIVEAKDTPTAIHANLHFGGPHPNNTSAGSTPYSDGTDFSLAYHTYAIEWEPTQIRWYCDGKNYKTEKKWWTGSKTDNGSFPAPFDQDFHVLLNVAIGGTYVNCTKPECITAKFPQRMYIDYVRVYQKE